MVDRLEKAPRWFLVLVTGACLIIMGFVGTNLYAAIDSTQKESARNSVRVETLEKRFDRFDDKLDRIGERVGVRPS